MIRHNFLCRNCGDCVGSVHVDGSSPGGEPGVSSPRPDAPVSYTEIEWHTPEERKRSVDAFRPGEFEERMKKIAQNDDPEHSHPEADKLMCLVLESLGYRGGVKVFKEMDKWYA